MQIAVLVKQVPDEIAAAGFAPDRTLDRSATTATDPVGRHALEAAVQLVEKRGGAVTALTMGPASAKAVLKEAVSVGAARGVLVSDDALAGSDALTTARVLASAVRLLGPFDLVLAGARSLDGGTAAVPGMLAELLDLPQVTNVTAIEDEDDALVCRQVLDDGYARVRLHLPGVVSVDEYVNTPRYPSIKSKLAANKATFDVLTAADLGVEPVGASAASAVVLDVAPVPTREPAARVTGATPEEIADRLVAALAARDIL